MEGPNRQHQTGVAREEESSREYLAKCRQEGARTHSDKRVSWPAREGDSQAKGTSKAVEGRSTGKRGVDGFIKAQEHNNFKAIGQL